MQVAYISSLIIAVLSNTLLTIILMRRIDRNANILVFIILLFFINAWGLPQIVVNLFHLEGELFIAVDKISALGYSFIPVVFLIFALSFINKLAILRNYLLLLFIFVPALFVLYLSWNTSLVEVRDFQFTQRQYWGYKVPIGPLFPAVAVWFEALIIGAMLIFIRLYLTAADAIKKKQAKWLIIALLVPFLIGTVTNAVLPILNIPVVPSAIPLTSIMAVIIAYAVFRYELFELSPQTILTSLGSGVITVDQNEKIVQINNSAKAILGMKKNIIGKAFSEIVNIKNHERHLPGRNYGKKLIKEALMTGMSFESSNYSFVAKNKKKFPVEFTITPICHQKMITGATLVFRNISKEKELEKSKNEFISIASHELKTPITAIKAFSQVLEKRVKKNKDKKDEYYISKISTQVDKITMLINDLLDVSRIEEGKLALNKNFFYMDELIKNLTEEFKYIAETHKIMIKKIVRQKIYADEDRIRQVLVNLITNAIKYSPQANKIILRCVKKNNFLVTSVADFGIGIPKKDQAHIFDRFYRSEAKQGSGVTGFGLGLYISSEIIKRHEGKLSVECPRKGGSIFSFTLPLKTG